MTKNHEISGSTGEAQTENSWSELEELGKKGFVAESGKVGGTGETTIEKQDGRVEEISQAAAKVKEVYRKQEEDRADEPEALEPGSEVMPIAEQSFAMDVPVLERREKKRRRKSVPERYDEGERHRVERIRSDIESSPFSLWDYQGRETKEEPSTFTKVRRLIADKLGIKSKRDEERREREAMHVALKEYHKEEAAAKRAHEEDLARIEAERAQREAEYKAEKERREREYIAQGMKQAREAFDLHKRDKFQKQRIQEIVERDLNTCLLKVDDLEVESLSENPEVQKRTVMYEGVEIPVYDLKGLPFAMLSTTIDYRSANKPGEIGTETYKAVMEDPAIWTRRRDEAEKESGFGTRDDNALGDTISASYYNSERNINSHVTGELIYGFEKVEADSVIAAVNGDAGSSNMAGTAETLLADVDAIKHLEGAGGTYIYNEVLMRRYSENGVPKRPDYIITENGRITEAALRHAKFYNVPIVNIEKPVYLEKARKRGEAIIDSISENDSYPEIDKKIDELLTMSSYKTRIRMLEGIGRAYDIPRLTVGATPLDEKYLEVSKLEQQKRLEFIRETLEKATKEVRMATEKGERAPRKPSGFSYFSAGVQEIGDSGFYSAPWNCNWVNVDFKLDGSSRFAKTRVYDGENIYKVDEALARGIKKQEDIDNADSSFYRRLEPIVQEYLDALHENEAVMVNG